MRTRVKICGFTRQQDAVYAAGLGVDAIGLVFYPPSPRNVGLDKAAEIVKALPAFVSVVALFVDADDAQIRRVLDNVAVDCLQFHGDETPAQCRNYGKPYLKAVRMRADVDIAEIARQYYDASALLLDTYHPELKGGSGHGFDWKLIPTDCPLPIVLAGGLTPETVTRAITETRPYALDVSSGVESRKGIKDAAKMAAFIRKTNEAITLE